MKKYILAAALAAAPLMASTSAHALTVPEGGTLSITIGGSYATQNEQDASIGSVLDLSNLTVSSINASSGVDLGTLSAGTVVTPSSSFTLQDGSNVGLAFTFSTDESLSFTINQSTGTFVLDNGPGFQGQSGLGVLANDNVDPGSYSYSTSSDAPTGSFLMTFNTPPDEDIEEQFSPVPLPASAWMVLAALGALVGFRRYAKS